MASVDPRLRLVMEEVGDRSEAEIAEAGFVPFGDRVGWATADGTTIEVLVADTPRAGGTVRPVRVPVTELRTLADDPAIERIEASRPLFPELNWSRLECRAEAVHTASRSLTGAGVVVAVVDSGIDYTHPGFLRADGGTRIAALWDQAEAAGPDRGDVPFGREYSRAQIDRALRSGDPLAVVPHIDRSPDGHGTHVAGIAAGGGDGMFTGVAPDADLIVVALDATGATLGTSARVAAALDYVRQRAGGRPVVVNLSQGTNAGGHGGESLLERRIDELSRQPGFVVVKSAGNERQQGVHAGGMLSPGEDHFVEFDVRPANHLDDVVEVWFSGRDDISVSVTPPTGPSAPRVRPGDTGTFDTMMGNRVRIDVDEDADGTGDRRATLIIQAGVAGQLQPGRWSVLLRAGQVADGRFDAWIERAPRIGPDAPEQSRFVAPARDPSRTVTVPGTARRVVTVGSYVTKSQAPDMLGRLSEFSSHGPTRDGRAKPDLAAPGEFITSAHAGWRADGVRQAALMGTSMAAPHVAGVAALVLQASPLLAAEQIGQVLRRAARTSGPAGGWGEGKLDAAAAVELARTAAFPVVLAVHTGDGRLTVKTAAPATARLMAAGMLLDSATESTVHEFDLSGLPGGEQRGTLTVTARGWATVDDNGGPGYPLRAGPPDRKPDGITGISGIDPDVAQRLGREGIESLAAVAASSDERLAEASGLPLDEVRDRDWTGQARKLLADHTRHPFTVVAVPGEEDRALSFEVVDGRTRERAVELDGAALLAFLSEHTGPPPEPAETSS